MTDGVTLPVLQDTLEAGVFSAYGASKWYIYLIDPQQQPVLLHYEMDLDAEQERLLAEIAAVVSR